MLIDVLETIETGYVNGGHRTTFCKVRINRKQMAFFVGDLTLEGPDFKTGQFFITRTVALDYYELWMKYIDLEAEDLTPAEEDLFVGIHGRTYSQMGSYINR